MGILTDVWARFIFRLRNKIPTFERPFTSFTSMAVSVDIEQDTLKRSVFGKTFYSESFPAGY